MIDPKLKRALGQMIKGVQVVATTHDGVTRAYTSHWVTQVAFEEPILMASVSPKHDTHRLIAASGWFTVSVLAGDQVEAGQYFSYPGRRFRYVAEEFLTGVDGMPVVADCIAWMRCDVFERKRLGDHELFFARITQYGYGRLTADPLTYSARHGWRIAGERARDKGVSIRDRLLARLGEEPTDESFDDEA